MRLPRLLVLTDRTQCPGSLVGTVATAVECGASAVVLREKDLAESDRHRLAASLSDVLGAVGGRLILAGPYGDAVHLAATDTFPDPRPSLVGRSCHDSTEVAAAQAEGCDYLTVSPVFATRSKPGYGPALGTDGLAALLADAPPTFALGGVRPDDVADCLAAGAHGVAAMGTVMRDPRTVSAYLAALGEVYG